MSESFQILRGSSIRLSSRRVCSSGLTSSQYLSRMIPESTIAFSTAGTCSRNRSVCSGVQKPITRSTPARLYQLRSKITTSPAAGKCADVPLDVHLRLLALGRRGQGDDPEHARAHPLGDPLDRAALAGRVPALEHDADLGARGLDPLLHRHQLAVQAPHLAARTPCASSSGCAGLCLLLRDGRRRDRRVVLHVLLLLLVLGHVAQLRSRVRARARRWRMARPTSEVASPTMAPTRDPTTTSPGKCTPVCTRE